MLWADQQFNSAGGIESPVWFAVTAQGALHVFVTPMPDADDPARDMVGPVMRDVFQKLDVVRYGRVAEVWSYDESGQVDGEMILVAAEDLTKGLVGIRPIIRANGAKPYLGEFRFALENPRGRLSNLLSKATVQ